MLWFTVSNAFWRTMKAPQANLLLFKALCICSVKLIKAETKLEFEKFLIFSRKKVDLWSTNFSNILLKLGSDIGI